MVMAYYFDTIGECAARCEAVPVCNGFMYYEPGDPNGRACYLQENAMLARPLNNSEASAGRQKFSALCVATAGQCKMICDALGSKCSGTSCNAAVSKCSGFRLQGGICTYFEGGLSHSRPLPSAAPSVCYEKAARCDDSTFTTSVAYACTEDAETDTVRDVLDDDECELA